MADPANLLATITEAQQQLSQLESTAKGLIDELASSGAQPTARLRELLATGERLVAAVQQAGGRLGSTLPPAGATLPPGPGRAAVEAVWATQVAAHAEPQLLPTPVSSPAGSLAELAASLRHLPDCRLELLDGREPVQQPDQAAAVLLHSGRAFVAVVQLQERGSVEPLRVGVLSMAEAAAAVAGRSSLWAPSQHAVFQQLLATAAAALQHFLRRQQQQGQQQAGTGTASTLELLLLWVATCGDVFSRRSTSTGALLLTDPASAGGGLLPPLRRPWQLSWQELWQAALNPRLRQAEHIDAGAGL